MKNLDKIKEAQRSEIDEESEMEVGLRVRRGKDWMWGDQDGNGTGTVIGHKSRTHSKYQCNNNVYKEVKFYNTLIISLLKQVISHMCNFCV
jgi:hypothetical protein